MRVYWPLLSGLAQDLGWGWDELGSLTRIMVRLGWWWSTRMMGEVVRWRELGAGFVLGLVSGLQHSSSCLGCKWAWNRSLCLCFCFHVLCFNYFKLLLLINKDSTSHHRKKKKQKKRILHLIPMFWFYNFIIRPASQISFSRRQHNWFINKQTCKK